MLSTIAISNYRSLRDLVTPLGGLNVVTGANGSGKSSFYRALRLLADVAQGRVISSLAREGGLQSTLWAGPETVSRAMRKGDVPVEGTRRWQPTYLRMGFASESDYSYLIDLGLPEKQPGRDGSRLSAFKLDPLIKRECLWHGPKLRPSTLIADRRGPLVRLIEGDLIVTSGLEPFDSMLTHVADPRNVPELLQLRESVRSWRFYDHFRTDADAPARSPQLGTRTPILSNDGADLAAAIQTILEVGDADGLDAAVSDAFPGSSVEIATEGRFVMRMRQHGLLRPLDAAELSDGTLRYLLWIAALMTPRPPALMVLNEPETSLHPDLLPALGRLIGKAVTAAKPQMQMIVVTHSRILIDNLESHPSYHPVQLEKFLGETRVAGQSSRPSWEWPGR